MSNQPRRQPPRKNPQAGAKRSPRKSPGLATHTATQDAPPPKVSRNPARPIPEDQLTQLPQLPPPADFTTVLVALASLDPMAQEVMIAQRLAAMPHPAFPDEGMPVGIDRRVRPPWANHLRKLGIFCIPELATHELVVKDRASGAELKSTMSNLKSMSTDKLWEIAKDENPEIAAIVENAHTPEEKEEAMRRLAATLPVPVRLALEKLRSTTPDELEPK